MNCSPITSTVMQKKRGLKYFLKKIEKHCVRDIKKNKNVALPLYVLASIYEIRHDAKQAIKYYKKILKLYPGCRTYNRLIAINYMAYNRYVIALNFYCKFKQEIQDKPEDKIHSVCNDVGVWLAQTKESKEATIFFGKSIILKPQEAIYHYNLGEVLGQIGSNKLAWYSLHKSAKLSPNISEIPKSIYRTPFKIDTSELLPPIFIVGCGHSGTSVMLNIIGSHSYIHAITYESSILMKHPEQMRVTFIDWNNHCEKTNKKLWIEKTPIHILYMEKAMIHQPGCKIILMLRDGRDVACSLKVREAYKNIHGATQRWVDDNYFGLSYWNSKQVKVVKYEDFVVAPEKTLKDIFCFLDIPYEHNILEYHKTPKFWFSQEIAKPDKIKSKEDYKNLRNWQINQPIFDGRGRWKTEMSEEEKDIFKSKAQDLLEIFGYVDHDQW